jgi:hypothetical protein
MDARGVLDTIVQSSVVGLMHAHGVAVAPMPIVRTAAAELAVDLLGLVKFDGKGLNGSLSFAIPTEVLSLVKQPVREPRDVIRELTNQLMGRVKNRLIQFQVMLQTGLPQVLDREQAAQRRGRSAAFAVYHFRTIRGELVVTLDGNIDGSALSYSGSIKLASEGDVILF